ncbi:MAG: glycosyltransferase [Lachnospiraceae bacterium]|nr:glycosyltransferase [Lachnospiraceae bacterium]
MLSIVVPVYNEADNIRPLFDCIHKEIHVEKEVMVVYDFEEDNTLPVIREIEHNYPFPIVYQRNKYDKGALNAIKTGMEESKGLAVLVMMADLSDGLSVVDTMYEKIDKEGCDLVCGSRYMKGGKQHGGPKFKGFLSRTAGVTLHLLTGIPTHDVTNSFKMYRKSMLDEITIESNGGFEIGEEITVKAYLQGFQIREVPAEWFDRAEGESRFRMWEWLPHYLHWYLLCIFGKKNRTRSRS